MGIAVKRIVRVGRKWHQRSSRAGHGSWMQSARNTASTAETRMGRAQVGIESNPQFTTTAKSDTGFAGLGCQWLRLPRRDHPLGVDQRKYWHPVMGGLLLVSRRSTAFADTETPQERRSLLHVLGGWTRPSFRVGKVDWWCSCFRVGIVAQLLRG